MNTKIYTKVGDKGETSVIGGQRVSKSNSLLDAYGTVDELNATLGVCHSGLAPYTECKNIREVLLRVQNELFVVGSHLACPDAEMRKKMPTLNGQIVAALETEIDQMTAALPELKEFILPGGHLLASQLHLSRTVCRRAERLAVSANATNEIIQFLNRLSDYLFVAARYVNLKMQVSEVKWSKN